MDRDSGWVSGFDERDPAVLKLMEMAIVAARRLSRYAGICGQSPSDFPEVTEWLVQHDISSISFNPDNIISMMHVVSETERKFPAT